MKLRKGGCLSGADVSEFRGRYSRAWNPDLEGGGAKQWRLVSLRKIQ